MPTDLRLMCVLAHPDDESLGTGGILAKYAAEGVHTCLVTATRGERGWNGPAEQNPGLYELGRMRQEELSCASAILGLKELIFLDYIDGDLDQADPQEITAALVGHIRRICPQVVVTFDGSGVYGHPDHIAISQFTVGALLAAADPSYQVEGQLPAHRVDKLYFTAITGKQTQDYEDVFGEIVMNVKGLDRRVAPWKDWAVTSLIDTSQYWREVWEAVSCHCTQLPNYPALVALPPQKHRQLWGEQAFYRVFSLVNGGPQLEYDLFEGLR